MKEQLYVRIDQETKETFMELVRQEGKTASEVIRRLVDEYVKERDMSAYLSRILDRMSDRAASEGYTSGDVERVVKEVREEADEGRN